MTYISQNQKDRMWSVPPLWWRTHWMKSPRLYLLNTWVYFQWQVPKRQTTLHSCLTLGALRWEREAQKQIIIIWCKNWSYLIKDSKAGTGGSDSHLLKGEDNSCLLEKSYMPVWKIPQDMIFHMHSIRTRDWGHWAKFWPCNVTLNPSVSHPNPSSSVSCPQNQGGFHTWPPVIRAESRPTIPRWGGILPYLLPR
jgi:hypothetical protein